MPTEGSIAKKRGKSKKKVNQKRKLLKERIRELA